MENLLLHFVSQWYMYISKLCIYLKRKSNTISPSLSNLWFCIIRVFFYINIIICQNCVNIIIINYVFYIKIIPKKISQKINFIIFINFKNLIFYFSSYKRHLLVINFKDVGKYLLPFLIFIFFLQQVTKIFLRKLC